MINTYQTSLAPPPVPPRLNRAQPVLIPAPLPSKGHSRPLIRFLVGVVVMHLFLSLAAFIYLYLKHQTEKNARSEQKGWTTGLDASQSASRSERRETSAVVSARMVIINPRSVSKTSLGHLEWNMKASHLKNINYYDKSWLTITQPGEYYVYSRVTFSRGDPKLPLASQVRLRNDKDGEEKVVMRASCYLDSKELSVPYMCTATQGEVIALESGNQLSVWVQNLTLVDYLEAATTFGMYKL